MNIEEKVFKKEKLNKEKLIPYGFIKEGNTYKYSKKFMNGNFRADIYIDENGNVSGKVYDLEMEEEYTNFRVEDDEVEKYLKQKGIYPSYHLSKKSWVSIILDDTLSDNEIMKLINISFESSDVKGEWIVPANPKYYDVINAFNRTDTITWKQSNNIIKGDTVYLYVAEPYSAIMFKCEVIETDIPYKYKDKNLSIKNVMKIKLLKRYKQDEFTFKKLNE